MPETDDRALYHITCMASAELKQRIEAACAKDGRGKSNWMRKAAEEKLARENG